ncbi:MAG: FAD synthase [Candidatus Methanomethylophilaceae archaeon]|nr:FAD synthase [Candidatus Methanomethylophilaceae archaeon]
MVTVMASGVFDIIHTGHISYLEQAKSVGDRLIVVVACDDTVRKRKHEPITPENMRLRIVQALKPVDEAILGYNNGDFYSTVQSIKPDIIMLGYDQTFDEKELEDSLKERGMDIRILRASELTADLTGTRKIVQKIRESMEE